MKLSKLVKGQLSGASKPSDPFSDLVKAAQAANRTHDWSKAAELYAQALDLKDNFGVRVQLGHMLKEAGCLDEAEQAYLKALSEKPEDGDLNLQIGHFYFVKNDLAQSLDYYTKAASIEPGNPTILEALRIGQSRLEDAPIRVPLALAIKALGKGRWVDAEKALLEIKALGRTDYLHLLGHAVKEQGRLNESVEIYQAYLGALPAEKGEAVYEAYLMIGQTLRTAGRYLEASNWLMEARAYRMGREGWVGSVDVLLDDVRNCIKRVHPSLDPSYIQ